mmetsp:Transcript_872/g.2546  ORF Transcript_872/g.2546 Transcript_872/m.2546 type:complete len:283 (-) Transcript_872:324-1172(-)
MPGRRQRRETPRSVVPACGCERELAQGLLAQAEHAKTQLGTALVVAGLELEERETLQQRALVICHSQHRFQVRLLILCRWRMVLGNENRHTLEVLLVGLQEQAVQALSWIGGVYAVFEARLVSLPQVVPRGVANRPRVLHRTAEVVQLPQPGQALEASAPWADSEGEGSRDVGFCTHNVELLLCIQQRIERTDQGPAEVLGPHWRLELQIRLIHQDDGQQGGMVDLETALLHKESMLQVGPVGIEDLRVAIEVGVRTISWHLQVRVIADSSDDAEALKQSLV